MRQDEAYKIIDYVADNHAEERAFDIAVALAIQDLQAEIRALKAQLKPPVFGETK